MMRVFPRGTPRHQAIPIQIIAFEGDKSEGA